MISLTGLLVIHTDKDSVSCNIHLLCMCRYNFINSIFKNKKNSFASIFCDKKKWWINIISCLSMSLSPPADSTLMVFCSPPAATSGWNYSSAQRWRSWSPYDLYTTDSLKKQQKDSQLTEKQGTGRAGASWHFKIRARNLSTSKLSKVGILLDHFGSC